MNGLLLVLSPILNMISAFLLPFWYALGLVFKCIAWLIFAPLDLLLKYSPIGMILRRYTHEHDCLEHIERETTRMQECKDDLLVHGKLKEFAEIALPPQKHPTWWQNVPRHLRRSVVVHGRLRETRYAPAQMLAGNTLTDDFVKKAWTASIQTATRAAWLIIIIGALCFIPLDAAIKSVYKPSATADTSMRDTRSVSNLDFAAQYDDLWSDEQVAKVNETFSKIDNAGSDWGKTASTIQSVVAAPLRWFFIALAILCAAAAAARYIFIGRLRFFVAHAIEQKVRDLRRPFREALQKWRYFLADRETNDQGINDQVHFAMHIDRSPLIYFGDASGEMEHNGHLLAPREGHEMSQSVVDMLQHTEVLGGSGESKSRDFYVPLLSQLLELRKKGYPIATYITDEKGAIVEDVINITQKLGLTDETIIIGTGANDWRVDLMDAGRPVLIAELIKSASRQAGSQGGGDDFWSEMGNDLMLNIWTITEVAELTKAGQQWNNQNNCRMHSIKNALRLATVDESLQEVIDIAMHGLEHEYERVGHLDTDAFFAASEYLVASWFPLVDATKDGIRANLRKALRTFTFKPEIAAGFADGVAYKLLPASQLHSNKIKVLNVSQIEHGSAGRLVNIFLKSAFFKQCRDVQQQDPAFAERRLAWWFNPNMDDKEKDSYYLEFFLADEYQSLITSDPTSGYSDATVWNVLRSAGVAGVTISQGVGAYEYAIGKEAAANVRRQWRSKHFLRSEDTTTIDEAKKLVGKTFRFQTSDWNHFENMTAIRRELGTDPDNLGKTVWRQEYESLGMFGRMNFGDIEQMQSYNDAYEYDDRFIVAANLHPSHDNSAAVMGSKQAAAWRFEDRQTAAMQHGLTDVDVLRDEQIMQMTRGRALTLLQVAGGTQVDIIRLNAKAYKRYTNDQSWT